jgi:hypothetical protein
VKAFTALFVLVTSSTAAHGQIADNSFLIEEAYNQERGVVQHISALLWQPSDGVWAYSFTQEWPLGGQTHQLSYTVPIAHPGSAGGTEFGNIAVNYRYQLVRSGEAGEGGRVAFAPRFTLLLGNASNRLGVQANLPVSAIVTPRLVAHANAGATLTHGSPDAVNLGGSMIWFARPAVHLLLETTWTRGAGVSTWLLSPGLRWAYNLAKGLQIVPGIAAPLGIGPSWGERSVFLYLSFEHPFRSMGH